jgi:hypothetical protein
MVQQLITALERPVSRVRLENYRHGGSDLDMVVNYFYNVELSEALYPALQAFEVALRNSVHLALTQHFNNDPFWFDTPGLYPLPRPPKTSPWQEDALRAARTKLSQEGKPHDPDRIVAEMHLGFWHALFNRPFERKLWRANRAALITQVFPHVPAKHRNRQDIWNRVDRIRIIRNRVMHYEPIWSRPRLPDDHRDILETLRWISEDMQESIAMCDRFPQVMKDGRLSVETRIDTEIQRRHHPT